MKYQCVTADFPTDPSPENANAPDLEKQPKTWTFSDWSVNRIPMVPKPPRGNWHLTPTYLLCALTPHSPLGSLSAVVLTALAAANTFRLRKQPTLLKPSISQS